MNIKEAAERAGVTRDTVRYYERIGIIPPIKRNKNGIRDLDDLDVKFLIFTKQMKDSGMSVEMLHDYMDHFNAGDSVESVQARIELLQEADHIIEDKINELQSIREHLKYKITNYDSHMISAQKELRGK